MYDSDFNGLGPTIILFRNKCEAGLLLDTEVLEGVEDYLSETITLAHEFGHHMAFIRSERPENIDDMWDRFPGHGRDCPRGGSCRCCFVDVEPG